MANSIEKMVAGLEATYQKNFRDMNVTTEIEKQLEKLADMYLENFFKEEN